MDARLLKFSRCDGHKKLYVMPYYIVVAVCDEIDELNGKIKELEAGK
jgi:hypothetical protein